MLSFFKKKKTPIISSFPINFVDIHSHLLPNIDDGSKGLDDSVTMLKRMRSYGIKNFIITPHIMEGVWENTPEIILSKLEALKSHLKSIGMNDITLHAAAEYMLDSNFNVLLETKNLLTLKDNKLLIEMSYFNAPVNLYDILFKIQIAGYSPILAHPERYSFYHQKYSEYQKLKDAGCIFQLNLLSLTPYYGSQVQATAIKLLKDNMYDFVGSDTHHNRHLNSLEKIENSKIMKLVQPLLENNTLFYSKD